ncbi:Protein of unknown function [Lachnospiraceae bacterium XBB1006]|nr:Protein of unknown function [Lachnospiraceae bacterium XBB1006]
MEYYKNDDMNKKKADSKLVGKYEKWEIEKLPLKYRCTLAQAEEAVKKFGPSRAEVERYLESKYDRR